jgi:hypothetical protein
MMVAVVRTVTLGLSVLRLEILALVQFDLDEHLFA